MVIACFKKMASGLIFLCLVQLCTAQPMGKVIKEKIVKSSIKTRSVNQTIYPLPDYSQSERNYPAVYLLHGYTCHNTGWLQNLVI